MGLIVSKLQKLVLHFLFQNQNIGSVESERKARVALIKYFIILQFEFKVIILTWRPVRKILPQLGQSKFPKEQYRKFKSVARKEYIKGKT